MWCLPKLDASTSLRKQMLRQFLGLAIVFLGITTALLIVIIVVSNAVMTSTSEAGLRAQVARHASDVASEQAKLLVGKLEHTAQGVVNPLAFANDDTVRPDYTMGYVPSYFDLRPEDLKQPLAQDERSVQPVSFGASSFYIPGFTTWQQYVDAAPAQTATINASVHLDPYYRRMYQDYTGFVALYTGFETDGMFRRYPGRSTTRSDDPTAAYDPRVRGWFQLGQSTSGAAFTSPYLDYHGLGWMITAVRASVAAGAVGVTGGDMLIDAVTRLVSGVSFLDSGKVTLLQADGTVVADPGWAADASDPGLFTYVDLSGPSISDEVWNDAKATEPGGNATVLTFTDVQSQTDEAYMVFAARPAQFGGTYIVLVSVKQSEILAPVMPVMDDTRAFNTLIILVVVATTIMFVMGITCIIRLTTNRLLRPLDDAMSNIHAIGQSLGGSTVPVAQVVDAGVGDELSQFAQHNNAMIQVLQQARTQQQDGAYRTNPFQGSSLTAQVALQHV